MGSGRAPKAVEGLGGAASAADDEKISTLCSMGFQREAVLAALQLGEGDVARAAELLLAE